MSAGGQCAEWGAAPCLCSPRASEQDKAAEGPWTLLITALTNLSSPLQQPFAAHEVNSSFFASSLGYNQLRKSSSHAASNSCKNFNLKNCKNKNLKLEIILQLGEHGCHEGKVCVGCRAAGFLQTIYPSRLRSEIFQSTSAIKYSGKQELLLYCGYLLKSQGNGDSTCCPPYLIAVGFKSWFASTNSFTIKTKEPLWKALKKKLLCGNPQLLGGRSGKKEEKILGPLLPDDKSQASTCSLQGGSLVLGAGCVVPALRAVSGAPSG